MTVIPFPTDFEEPRPRCITREEGRAIVDERARRFCGMSYEEFRRRAEAGELDLKDDGEDDHILGVWMLLPLAE